MITQIGRYDIVRRSGQTPLGTIYEAVDRETRRTVAIQAAEETCSESVGRLNHPNIRNLIAVEQADGRVFLVLEHLDACPLLEFLAAHQSAPAEIVKLLKAAAVALDHATAAGVSHPGLTPRHLLVNSDGLLKIAGFELPGVDALTCPSTIDAEREELERSVPYRAPEFLSGEYDISRATQFSLGAIAFEALTGKRVFDAASPFLTMARILRGRTADPALVESKHSVAVRRVLERMLSSDPALRYANCTQAVETLESSLLRKAASETRVTDAPEEPAPVAPSFSERIVGAKERNTRRLRWIIAATVVTALAMAGLILSQLLHQRTVASPKETITATNPSPVSVPPAPTPSKPALPAATAPSAENQPPAAPKPVKRKAAPKKDTLQMFEPTVDK